jgi:hypothetical protein
VFLGRNNIFDSTLIETWLSVQEPGLADRTFSNQSILSPAGRSAKMPAVFFISAFACAAAT